MTPNSSMCYLVLLAFSHLLHSWLPCPASAPSNILHNLFIVQLYCILSDSSYYVSTVSSIRAGIFVYLSSPPPSIYQYSQILTRHRWVLVEWVKDCRWSSNFIEKFWYCVCQRYQWKLGPYFCNKTLLLSSIYIIFFLCSQLLFLIGSFILTSIKMAICFTNTWYLQIWLMDWS